ncbi:hypothetical protein GE21DRAFT_1282958 [Neurospora crassa]|nr:hypothetical protein GE21DRAFT_1282958 [Neurospora crassa]
MDSVKRALDKGMDKATNPKDEPQVLNKSSSSSQSHALNINPNLTDRHPSLTGSGGGGFDQQHHHVVGEMPQPGSGQRSVGSTGAGINTSDRRAVNQHARDMGYGPGTQPCYSGTEPQLGGLHRGSVGSVGSADSSVSSGGVEGVGMGMQSHGRYEHRQPSLQEQRRGERMGWDIGEHFDV